MFQPAGYRIMIKACRTGNIFCVVFLLVAQGCATGDDAQVDISGQGLIDRMNSGWEPAIVDVRSGMEYEGGHVPGAKHVPFWSLLFSADGLEADPEKPVVVYCEHGPRAYIAGFGLRNAGYKQIYYLRGHMSKWRSSGLPIEKPSGGD